MNVLNSLNKSIDVNEEVLSMLNGNFYIMGTQKNININYFTNIIIILKLVSDKYILIFLILLILI